MQIKKIEGEFAWVRAGGLTKRINIKFTPQVKEGDYVLVHVGFAIQIIDPQKAAQMLKMIKDEVSR